MRFLTMILIALLFNACQFNQSTKKDLITGAYSRGDGLGSDDVQIEINGKEVSRTTYVYGEKVYFIFNDIRGLKKIDGISFPGLSMYVVDHKQDTVFAEPNLIGNLENGTDLSPLQLRANFVAALPVDKDYKIFLHIWDTKGDGTLRFEMPFKVEESKLLNLTTSNIKYSTIYLWNDSKKQPVLDKNIDINDKYILISEKIKGLKTINGKVYPNLSIVIEDNKGNTILSNTNVLSQYETSGVNANNFSEGQLPLTISFKKGKIFNPCTLKVSLTDKNSSNRLDITSELIIK